MKERTRMAEVMTMYGTLAAGSGISTMVHPFVGGVFAVGMVALYIVHKRWPNGWGRITGDE